MSQEVTSMATQVYGLLDETVEHVMVQFHTTEISKLPEACRKLAEEAAVPLTGKRIPGTQVIGPTRLVSGKGLPHDLTRAGYRLYDAYLQERKMEFGGKFWVIRFFWGPAARVEIEDGALDYLNRCSKLYDRLVSEAIWDVRAYRNPFFENNEPVDGRYTLSINFSGRTPFRDAHGHLIMAYDRNERGHRRLTEGRKPITAVHRLTVVDSTVQLTPAT